MIKLSFCITCKNRLFQLSKTLAKNLKDNIALAGEIEFILVDFDSNDGLKAFILNNFSNELSTGYLKYYFTKDLHNWDASIAKNTSHFLATGSIVVNLDCDNFTGLNGAKYVISQFKKHGNEIILHQSSSRPGDGSFGRISVLKKYFDLVGGYDETFDPMGVQDVDLIKRLLKLGLMYIPKTNLKYNKAIQNTKEVSIQYTNSSKTYQNMCENNQSISVFNLLTGNIIANTGNYGIRENLESY